MDPPFHRQERGFAPSLAFRRRGRQLVRQACRARRRGPSIKRYREPRRPSRAPYVPGCFCIASHARSASCAAARNRLVTTGPGRHNESQPPRALVGGSSDQGQGQNVASLLDQSGRAATLEVLKWRPVQPPMRLAVSLALALLSAACIATTQTTNSTSCTPGQLCFCETSEPCALSCPGAGCELVCQGSGPCSLDCPAGGCTLRNDNSSPATLTCAGNGCRVDCTGSGRCSLESCTKNCACSESGSGTCSDDCTDPTCS